MNERLRAFTEKVIARGCLCKSSAVKDWHTEHCPIPDAREILAQLERAQPATPSGESDYDQKAVSIIHNVGASSVP